MKVPAIWVFFFVAGASLLLFTFSISSSIPGVEFPKHGGFQSLAERKLKGNGYNPRSGNKISNFDLDDYHPIDPVPSSKASIKPGPIEHGSPLIPYIPKPSPPGHPKSGGST